MPCDSGPSNDIGVLMGKCMVPRYDIEERTEERRRTQRAAEELAADREAEAARAV